MLMSSPWCYGLDQEEIQHLANGIVNEISDLNSMPGEFAARSKLKEQGITNRTDQDKVIIKALGIVASRPVPPPVKKIKKDDPIALDQQGPPEKPNVSPAAEQILVDWYLQGLDADDMITQIRTMPESDVKKQLVFNYRKFIRYEDYMRDLRQDLPSLVSEFAGKVDIGSMQGKMKLRAMLKAKSTDRKNYEDLYDPLIAELKKLQGSGTASAGVASQGDIGRWVDQYGDALCNSLGNSVIDFDAINQAAGGVITVAAPAVSSGSNLDQSSPSPAPSKAKAGGLGSLFAGGANPFANPKLKPVSGQNEEAPVLGRLSDDRKKMLEEMLKKQQKHPGAKIASAPPTSSNNTASSGAGIAVSGFAPLTIDSDGQRYLVAAVQAKCTGQPMPQTTVPVSPSQQQPFFGAGGRGRPPQTGRTGSDLTMALRLASNL